MHNQKYIGKVQEILIEGPSRKSDAQFCGRNSQNAMVVFDRGETKPGDYISVLIEDCTAATLFGSIVEN
jgi:tRNA-2-methylthio-N6-dimethylallyladenosine synthase